MPGVQVATAWNGSDTLSGTIIKFPGIPDMYDHERVACGVPTLPGFAKFLSLAQKFAKFADGYIVPTAVKAFLDKAVNDHGPKSALYISFG
jgi:hypothetical protein